MRAPAVVVLLLLPIAAAGADIVADPIIGDLVVTLRKGAEPPAGAQMLSVVPAFVLFDATSREYEGMLRDPRVERVDRAQPLEFHGAPALPASAFHDLTRAAPREFTGLGVTVAVLDSGIDAAHPDLAGRVKENVRLVDRRFLSAPGDADGHGTHVAGILAASGASSDGRWAGVAPDAELVGLDISGRFTTASALLAYDWLYSQRDILSIDIVVNAWGRIGQGEAFDPRDPEIRAIDRLVASGVVVLFSASNRGPGPGTLSLEAMDPRVITVGATDAAGQVMEYTSRGPVRSNAPWPKPDVVAPGDAAVGPRSGQTSPRAEDPDPLHTVYSGTSQAVPHVGGIVAQMLQARPGLSPADVAAALRASAIDIDAPGADDATGFGLVDAPDAIRIARGSSAERTNVLVAGGTDIASDTADLAATGRRNFLDVVTKPQLIWETPFVVKTGAESLRVEATAEGAQSLGVELVKGSRVYRDAEIERPEPGIWLFRLRGALPTATRADARFEVTLPAHPERALQTDGRVRSPALPSPEHELIGGIDRFVWLPLAMWGASGAVLAFAIMPQRSSGALRRPRGETPAVPGPQGANGAQQLPER